MTALDDPDIVTFDHYSGAALLASRMRSRTTAHEMLEDIDFDTFVVSGRSGLLMGVTLANSMSKLLLIPPRPYERSHESDVFIGECGSRMLFLDDFIGTGYTMQEVAKRVSRITRLRKSKWVGAYLYKPEARYDSIESEVCARLREYIGEPCAT